MKDLLPYKDRLQAGKKLARALRTQVHRPDAIVLALPRGGVPVGFAIASALRLPLDILLVRKLGMPGHEEYAIRAVGSGHITVLREGALEQCRISQDALDVLRSAALAELDRRDRYYRKGRPPPLIAGRTVILVDDGIATGASMRAAVEVVRAQDPAELVIAAPVGAPDSCLALQREANALVCPLQPPRFQAVGQWYRHFEQTGDDEVVDLLTTAWSKEGRHRAA